MPDTAPEPDSQPFVPVAPEPEASAGAPTQAVPWAPIEAGTSRPRGGTATWVNVALALAIAFAIGGIGFAAGRMTAPTALTSSLGAGSGRTFNGGQVPNGPVPGGQVPGGGQDGGTFRGGFFGDDGGLRGALGAGGLSVQGTIQSIGGGVMTLRLASGQTIQIALSGTTAYHSEAAASSSDLTTGGTVIVRLQLSRDAGSGTTSSTATDVTIVP